MQSAALVWTTAPTTIPADAWTPARIGRRYLAGLAILFAAGLLPALLVRLELLTPGAGRLGAEFCGRLISLHGLLLIYFVAVPGLPALLTSFHLPAALGVRALAFPRLHRLGWWLYAAGGALMLLGGLLGGVKFGWTFTNAHSAQLTPGPAVLIMAAVLLAGLATLINAVLAVTSVHVQRPAGRRAIDLPVSVWALYAASAILIVATPVLLATLVFIVAERLFDAGWTVAATGGDAGFLRHLFWFYATPALYALFLPALGLAAEVAEARSGAPLRGRRHAILALLAMIPLSFLLWGRHFLAAPESVAFGLTASLLNHLVLVPVGVLLVLVSASLAAGRTARADAATLYAWGFVAYAVAGAMSGLPLASGAVSKLVHNTQFDVGHLHLFLAGAVLAAALAGLHHLLPRLTGRTPEPTAARSAAQVVLAGVGLTFLPLLFLGLKGLPRRLYTYPEEFQVGHVLSTAGFTILLVGLVWAGTNLLRARRTATAS